MRTFHFPVVLTTVAFAVLSSTVLRAQVAPPPPRPQPPNANQTPKFPPSSGGHEINGAHSSCHSTCTAGPVRFTPDVTEGCAGIPIKTNFRITTDPDHSTLLSRRGDGIESQGGQADWGDGTTTDLAASPLKCCEWDLTHVYSQAGNYLASAQYRQQFTNAHNPRGGCSYLCQDGQQTNVTIYLATSPMCAGGRFHSAKKTKIP